jgi:hypothetical protein
MHTMEYISTTKNNPLIFYMSIIVDYSGNYINKASTLNGPNTKL